jgi:hypothetical protein
VIRFLLFVLLVSLVPSVVLAADADTTAETILVRNSDVLRGSFTEEKHLQGFNGPINSEGHFVVAPEHGVIWDIEKPFATTTVITPVGLVQSVGGVNVMRLPAQKIPFMLRLYDMLGGVLAGNWKALETDFIVTRSGDDQNWQVMLSPRHTNNPAMPFSSITVSGHQFVENVVLLKPDGDSDSLTFLHEVLSSKPPSAAEKRAFNSVHP